MRGQGTAARWARQATRPAGPLAGIHLDGLGHRTRLVGQLRKREAQLIGTDAFGFLPEKPPTQDVELMLQCRVGPLRPCQLLAQRGDEGLRRREIGDISRVGHAGMIREPPSPYNDELRDALVPTAAAGLRHIDAREQQREVGAAHLDRATRLVRRPGKGPLLEPLVEDPESGSVPCQHLQAVAAPIPKQKQMPGERVQREALPHKRRQAIDRSPQIGRPGRQVNPDRG